MIHTLNFTRFPRVFLTFALLTTGASAYFACPARAAVPLLQWNFDHDTGTAVANSGTLPGGALTTVPPVVHGTPGSGFSGAQTDIALDAQNNHYLDPATSGLAASTTGDITSASLSQLTITGWLKDTGSSNYGAGNFFGEPRILTIGPTNYDGGLNVPGSLHLRVFNGFYGGNFQSGQLQFVVNGAGGADNQNGVVSTVANGFDGILPSTDAWTFFAVTYNSSTPSNTVSMYIGDTTPAGAITAPKFTAAYPLNSSQTTVTPGPVQFAGARAYLLNNSAKSQGYIGLGDDFRLYGQLLSAADLDRVRQGLAPITTGDWDLDGATTPSDLPAMLDALTDLAKYQTDHNLTADQLNKIGDFDADGTVTNLDIQAEIDLISTSGAGSLAAVPEPSAITLVGGILASLGFCRFLGGKRFFCHFVRQQNKVLASVVMAH